MSCSRKERFKNPKNHPNYKNGNSLKQHYCKKCSKEISYQAKLCQSCYSKSILKENNTRWIKNKERYCIDCGKQLNKNAFWIETKRCQTCAKIYTLNPNWVDGRSYEPYTSEWTEELREQIRKRDNYTCQNCGMTEKEHLIAIGRILEIHHIDYDKKNCNEDNLVTLCMSCNIRANYNRNYWKSIYLNKLLKKVKD
jgi:hypothetical protein